MLSEREQSEVRSNLVAILSAFCGDDSGRSVAFRAHVPALQDVAIRGREPRPAASVIKIPLAMAVLQLAEEKQIDLGKGVPVDALPPTRYVSVLAAFDRGRELSIREVCRLALITSDNPLAVYLQTLVGFDRVNQLLQAIGCAPPCRMVAGFSEEELGPRNRANVLTAEAAVQLLSVLRSNILYEDLILGLKNNLRNNRMPALLPEHVAVIHKTGSLEGVANDVGIVQDDRVDFSLAFFTDGQKDPIRTSNEIAACTLDVYRLLCTCS